jgi:hypothetical protein
VARVVALSKKGKKAVGAEVNKDEVKIRSWGKGKGNIHCRDCMWQTL